MLISMCSPARSGSDGGGATPTSSGAVAGVAGEGEADLVVRSRPQPVRAPPQWHHGVDGQVAARVELDFDPQVGAARERSQLVHHFERSLAVTVLDGRDIDQVVVAL